jgi:hypothetical protein
MERRTNGLSPREEQAKMNFGNHRKGIIISLDYRNIRLVKASSLANLPSTGSDVRKAAAQLRTNRSMTSKETEKANTALQGDVPDLAGTGRAAVYAKEGIFGDLMTHLQLVPSAPHATMRGEKISETPSEWATCIRTVRHLSLNVCPYKVSFNGLKRLDHTSELEFEDWLLLRILPVLKKRESTPTLILGSDEGLEPEKACREYLQKQRWWSAVQSRSLSTVLWA